MPTDTNHPPFWTLALWRDLRRGSAGVGTRIAITLSLGLVLTGLALAGSFVLAAIIPDVFSRTTVRFGNRRPTVYVSEMVMAVLFSLAALVYFPAILWIWSRPMRHRMFWLAATMTVGIGILVITLGIAVEEWMSGDTEIVISGLVCLGGGAAMLLWVETYRRYIRNRPAREGPVRIDPQCPACGYSMVGLSETRCPECGASYTIDQFIGGQVFVDGQATTPPITDKRHTDVLADTGS